jgi:hypothetical protein
VILELLEGVFPADLGIIVQNCGCFLLFHLLCALVEKVIHIRKKSWVSQEFTTLHFSMEPKCGQNPSKIKQCPLITSNFSKNAYVATQKQPHTSQTTRLPKISEHIHRNLTSTGFRTQGKVCCKALGTKKLELQRVLREAHFATIDQKPGDVLGSLYPERGTESRYTHEQHIIQL